MNDQTGYRGILVATDFSAYAQAGLERGVWIAQQAGSPLVLAHAIADLRKAVSHASHRSQLEFLQGKEEHFQREIRRDSDEQLKAAIAACGETGVRITYETLLGEPYIELIHSVQQEGHELVVAGTRGHSAWKRLILGSTAMRLVRKCPSSVWIVRHDHMRPIRAVVVAVDMSDVSRRALLQALWVARHAAAALHVVHVVDSKSIPEGLLDTKTKDGKPVRQSIEEEAGRHLDEVLAKVAWGSVKPVRHLLGGTPHAAIVDLAKSLQADLIVLGTVGRSGIQGLLLGNTAEQVLAACECDVLTVKPLDFVSPIAPPAHKLHPGPAQ